MGTETAKNHTLPDLKEYFHIGPEKSSSLFDADIPNNLWPDLEGTDFKDVAFSYFTAIHHTAQLVLSRFETHLGLNQGDLTRHTLYGNSVLRLLHYPPVPENDSKSGHVRAAAHEDINLITLLPHTSESGLQILPRGSKEWIPVVTQKSDIICDTGDMMTILTNGYFPATTHQVVNSEESGVQSRYSLPFFVHPDSHLVLRSFRQCKNQQTGTLHHPIKAHEYLQQRLRENGIKGNKA
jgi:isopenicillin N synthase-like dioxygenase